jgi:hypothetical protein
LVAIREVIVMEMHMLKAFQILDSQSTMKDVLEACRQLFMHSDEYNWSIQYPFDSSEVNAVANAMYEYILDPDVPLREIAFHVSRPLEGKSIEYCEYASKYSGDMLYQNYSIEFSSLDLDDLRRSLKTFLLGIIFRYQFCVDEDRTAFPVSIILHYIDGVRILFSREKRENDLSDALFTTLSALRSLEPRYRMEEKVKQLAMDGKGDVTGFHNDNDDQEKQSDN